MKRILSILLALTLLVGCANNDSNSNSSADKGSNDVKTIKIGVTGTDSKVWKHIAEKVKNKNINLEIVYFDAYNLPNAALAQKEIDLNAFQHYSFLDKESKDLGYDFTVLADTVIAPLGIYSKSIDDLSKLEDGAKIAIPDDPSNGGRALKLLESAGLLTVNPDAGLLPTIKDINDNPRNFEIIELAATNIPPVLDELQVAVINSGVAVDSGFVPKEDSLFLEKFENSTGEKSPYTNVIVSRTEDKDKEEFKDILEAYYTDEVKEIIKKDSNGGSIPVWE